MDVELLMILEAIRQRYNASVSISSGCRCPSHNAAVGGSDNSQHLIGRAADITVEGVLPKEIARYAESIWPNQYGIGRYDTFTHLDSRKTKARWG